MIRNKYAAFALYLVVFIAFGTLLDWFFVTFITKGHFTFDLLRDGGISLMVGLLTGYFFIWKKY